ncbi:hypothetical protein ACLOJK_005003 [Asimina triloba]
MADTVITSDKPSFNATNETRLICHVGWGTLLLTCKIWKKQEQLLRNLSKDLKPLSLIFFT